MAATVAGDATGRGGGSVGGPAGRGLVLCWPWLPMARRVHWAGRASRAGPRPARLLSRSRRSPAGPRRRPAWSESSRPARDPIDWASIDVRSGRGRLSIEPAVAAPVADAEVPVVFPGYVLPDDSLEEPAHEGS